MIGQRGSRRLLYDLDSVLAARNSQTQDLLARLRQAERLAPDAKRRQIPRDMAVVLQDVVDQMPELVRHIRERKRG